MLCNVEKSDPERKSSQLYSFNTSYNVETSNRVTDKEFENYAFLLLTSI